MAKKGISVAERLKETKDFYEDAREVCPDLMPIFYGDPTRKSPALLKAADYFRIDLSSAVETAFLLRTLAAVAFPERGRSKGTKHWNIDRLKTLGEHWFEVEQAVPGVSDSKAAKAIWKKYPKQYQSDEAIRPNLPDARMVFVPARELVDKKIKKTPIEDLEGSWEVAQRFVHLVIESLEGSSRAKRRIHLKWLANWFSKINKAREGLRDEAKRLQTEVKRLQTEAASNPIRAGE